MILGKVCGTLWGAKQSEELVGRRLVQVRPLKLGVEWTDVDADVPDEWLDKDVIVAVDELGADIGQLVLVAIGSRVRDITVGKYVPTKAVVVGIVDQAGRQW